MFQNMLGEQQAKILKVFEDSRLVAYLKRCVTCELRSRENQIVKRIERRRLKLEDGTA